MRAWRDVRGEEVGVEGGRREAGGEAKLPGLVVAPGRSRERVKAAEPAAGGKGGERRAAWFSKFTPAGARAHPARFVS